MKKLLPVLGFIGLLLFTLTTCNSTKKTPPPKGDDKVELSGQLHVWLTETGKVQKIEMDFAAYELKSRGPASRTEKKFLFYFNPELIDSSELIKKLEAHRGVEKAEVVMMKK